MEWERTRAVAGRMVEVERTGSTNADLVRGVGGWPHLGILVTRDQRAGRGRLDRTWIAPPGAALAISVVLRVPGLPLSARSWIPLAAGLAMRDAVAAQAPAHAVGVKWPNDVLVADGDGALRKICGILAEAAQDAVVVGAGVNTRLAADELPVPTATSFAALGLTADDDALVAAYVTRLDDLLGRLSRAEGDAVASGVRDEVADACVTLGREVTVSLPDGGALRGTATAIAPDGRLVVDAAEGAVAVSAGDVVHVR
ncbi:biotin--[acetyl-CoA-carboxylase] ligase [Microbacterium gilvum]|uniref:biotin--[biotin carboxyl-carrier protein] ligase n=1 Tax=Microbacterium gilvum TaxID=1336204 RepID=A0ABP9AUW5_9MICO